MVSTRHLLDRRLAELEQRYANGEIPRPSHWGGYRVRPRAVESRQGRGNRMHNCLRYRREPDGGWPIERLAP